jgi:hypothetical protein
VVVADSPGILVVSLVRACTNQLECSSRELHVLDPHFVYSSYSAFQRSLLKLFLEVLRFFFCPSFSWLSILPVALRFVNFPTENINSSTYQNLDSWQP